MAEFGEFLINKMKPNLEPEYNDIINRKIQLYPEFDEIDSLDSLDLDKIGVPTYSSSSSSSCSIQTHNYVNDYEYNNLNNSCQKNFYENDNKCQEVIKSIRETNNIKNISNHSLNKLNNVIEEKNQVEPIFKASTIMNNKIKKDKKRRSIDDKTRVCKITRKGFMPKKFKYSITEYSQEPFLNFYFNRNINFLNDKKNQQSLKYLNDNFLLASGNYEKTWMNLTKKYYVNKNTLTKNVSTENKIETKKARGIKLILNHPNATGFRNFLFKTFNKKNKFKTYHQNCANLDTKDSQTETENSNFVFLKKSKSELNIANYKPLLISSQEQINSKSSSSSNSSNFLTSIQSLNQKMISSSTYSKSTPSSTRSISKSEYKQSSLKSSNSQKETLNPLYRSNSAIFNNENDKNEIEISENNIIDDENTIASTTNNNLNKVTTLTTMNTTSTLINNNNNNNNYNDKIIYNIKNDDQHVYENASNTSSNTQIKLTFSNSSDNNNDNNNTNNNNNNELTKTSNLLISSCSSNNSCNNSKSLRPTVKFEINQLLAENNCQIIDNSCKKNNNNNKSKKIKNTNPAILTIKKLITNSKKIKQNLNNKSNKMNQNNINNFNNDNYNTDINMHKMMNAFKILLNDNKNSDKIHQIIRQNIILNNNKQKANQQLRQLLQQQLNQQDKNILTTTNNKQQLNQQNKNILTTRNNKQQQKHPTSRINIPNTNKLNAKVINSLIKTNNIAPKIKINSNTINSAKKINNRVNSIDSSYPYGQNTNNQQINKQKPPSLSYHKPSLTSSKNNNSNNYHQIDSNQIYSIISVEKSKVFNNNNNNKNNNKPSNNSNRNNKKKNSSTSSSLSISDSTSASIESFTFHQSKNFYNLQQSNDNTLNHSNHNNTQKEIIKQQVRLIKKKQHHFHQEENIYSNNTKLFDKFNLFSLYFNKMKTKNTTTKTDSTNSLITTNSTTNDNYQFKSKLTPGKATVNLSPSHDSKNPPSTSSANNYQPLIQNNINKQKLLSSWDKVIKKASKDPSSIEKMLKSKSYKSSAKKKKTTVINNANANKETNNNKEPSKASTLKSTNSEFNSENKDMISNNSSSGLSSNMSKFFKNFKSKNKKKQTDLNSKNFNDNKIDDYENRYEKIKTNKNIKKEDLEAAAAANDDFNKEKINEILLSGVVTAGKQGELIKCLFSYLNSYGEDGFTIKQQQPSNNINNLPDFKNINNETPVKADVFKNAKQNEQQPPPPPPIQTLPLTSASSDSSTNQSPSSQINIKNNVLQNSDSSVSQSSCLTSSFDNKSISKVVNDKKITSSNQKSIFPFYLKCCIDRKLGSRSTIGSEMVEMINNNNNDNNGENTTSITENDAIILSNQVQNQPILQIKSTKEASTSNTDLSVRLCEHVNLEKVKEEVTNIENKFKRKDNTIDIDNLIETLDHAGQIDYLRKKLSVYLKSKNNNKKLIEDLNNITASITSNSIYEKHQNRSGYIEKNIIYSSNKMLNNDDYKTKKSIISNKRNSMINTNNNNIKKADEILQIDDLKNTKKSKSYLDLYGDESQFIYDNKDANEISTEIVANINTEKRNNSIKNEQKVETEIELKIVKDDMNEIKSSLKEANEMKQIIKLIESKESKFARLKEKIEANRLASADAAKKKKSIRSYKTTDQLDLDMFYFTSESPTRPTMKTRTQKFLSGFYKQLTGNKSATSYTSVSKPELVGDLFASDMDKKTMKKFKTINKIKNKNDGTFYFRIIPNNEEEKTEIITINNNEKYPIIEKDQPFFVKKFNSVVSNLDNREIKVCSSNLDLFENDNKIIKNKNETLPISTEMKVEVITKINAEPLPIPSVSAKKQLNHDDTIRKYEKLMPKDYISDNDEQKNKNKLILNETLKPTKLNRFKSDLFNSNKSKKQNINFKYELKAINLKSKQAQHHNQDKKIKKKLKSNSVKREIKYIQTKPNPLANPIQISQLLDRSQKELKNIKQNDANQKIKQAQLPPINKQLKQQQPSPLVSKNTKQVIENRNSTIDLNANFKRRQSKRGMAKPIVVKQDQFKIVNSNNNNIDAIKNNIQKPKNIKDTPLNVDKKTTKKLLNKLLKKNPTIINKVSNKESTYVNQPINNAKNVCNKNQINRAVPLRLSKRNTSTPISLNKYRMSGRRK